LTRLRAAAANGLRPQSNVAGWARVVLMLRVHVRYLAVLRSLRPVLDAIESRDRDLARQLRRSLASVASNMGEGSGNEGGTRRQRFLSSLGSLRESVAGLEVADALGYVVIPQALMVELGGVIGTLVVLVHGKR
jgi:four helix bundle protein